MDAAVGFSASTDSAAALDEALGAVSSQLGGTADFALILASSDHAEEVRHLGSEVEQRLGAPAVVGASSSGVIALDGEHEGSAGLGILALKGVRAASRLAASAEQVEEFLASAPDGALTIALPDPRRADERLLEAIKSSTRPIVGAGATGRGQALFGLAGSAAGEGQCPLAWVDGLKVAIGITQAVTPATEFRKVTRARNRAVLEIDGVPAAQVFGEFVSGQHLASPEQLPGLLLTAVRAGPSHPYVVRPIVGLDPQSGALLFQENVTSGVELAFAWRETIEATRDRATMLKWIQGALDGEPVAALYFNCEGRGQSLFLEADADLSAIRRALPGVPILGMASSFELGPFDGAIRLLMYSGVLVVLTR